MTELPGGSVSSKAVDWSEGARGRGGEGGSSRIYQMKHFPDQRSVSVFLFCVSYRVTVLVTVLCSTIYVTQYVLY